LNEAANFPIGERVPISRKSVRINQRWQRTSPPRSNLFDSSLLPTC
jgi:hypothetical protein